MGLKRVVAGVIHRDGRYLVIRRGRSLDRFPGLLCFPGGNVEDTDKTPGNAVLRELAEETGLSFHTVPKEPDFVYVSMEHGFIVEFYNLELPQIHDLSLRIPFREVEELMFLTIKEMCGFPNEALIPSLLAWRLEMDARWSRSNVDEPFDQTKNTCYKCGQAIPGCSRKGGPCLNCNPEH